jgi:hypothetical protein
VLSTENGRRSLQETLHRLRVSADRGWWLWSLQFPVGSPLRRLRRGRKARFFLSLGRSQGEMSRYETEGVFEQGPRTDATYSPAPPSH